MGDLKVGDRVINDFGGCGVVTAEKVAVLFEDGSSGIFNPSSFGLVPRQWKEGQFARVVDGVDPEYDGKVVFIFEDDGDPEDEEPYWGIFTHRDLGEVPFNADELIPWVPIAGERVAVIDEEDEPGTIIGLDSAVAIVDWDDYPVPQQWLVSELEPSFEDEDEFEVGDEVVYSNGMFHADAEIIDTSENVIWVNFKGGPLMNGAYPKEFFSRKVA